MTYQKSISNIAEIFLSSVFSVGMAIRAWPAARPAGPQKKRGVGQDIEPTGPRGLGPHRPAAHAGRPASPQARIKLKKKKTCTCVY